jgi:hypothetical protein
MTVFGLQILPTIASAVEFYEPGRKLSINDISLPMGGLFDIKGGWTKDHQTHRLGDAADFNLNPNNCSQSPDPAFTNAVDALLKRKKLRQGDRSAAYCEGNHWHVNFTELTE